MFSTARVASWAIWLYAACNNMQNSEVAATWCSLSYFHKYIYTYTHTHIHAHAIKSVLFTLAATQRHVLHATCAANTKFSPGSQPTNQPTRQPVSAAWKKGQQMANWNVMNVDVCLPCTNRRHLPSMPPAKWRRGAQLAHTNDNNSSNNNNNGEKPRHMHKNALNFSLLHNFHAATAVVVVLCILYNICPFCFFFCFAF